MKRRLTAEQRALRERLFGACCPIHGLGPGPKPLMAHVEQVATLVEALRRRQAPTLVTDLNARLRTTSTERTVNA